jgi:DNA-directed RNA polymerase subunit RPC12/RpoP
MTDDTTLTIPCPDCGHGTDESFRRIEREGHVTCAACGHRIAIDPEDLIRTITTAIEQEATSIVRQIRRLTRGSAEQ